MNQKTTKKTFLVRMTEDELKALDLKVSQTVMSREQFVREIICGAKINERPPAEYGDIVKQLRRIGANIDQLLVLARIHGFVDQLKNIADKIDEMDLMFIKSFTMK